MSTRNTFKLLFLLNKSKSNNQGAPIILRLTVNGSTASMNVGLRIPEKEWDVKNRQPKPKCNQFMEISMHMETLKSKAYQAYGELMREHEEITAEQVRNRMQGRDGDQIRTIIGIWTEHNEELHKMIGKATSYTLYQKHQTCMKHFKDFLKAQYNMKDLPIRQVRYNVVREFHQFLRFDKGLMENTAIKFLQNFKKIINRALRSGWLSTDPFEGMSLRLKETDRAYLTEAELKRIEENTFKVNRLEQVKDLFIFACYTGLSYSDVKKLKRSEIEQTPDGLWWIKTRRQKTKTKSQVPMLARAKAIIDKHCLLEYLKAEEPIFKVLSNQKLNAYLKEIADLCGIEKKLTFHVARHTFATTVTLQNGVSIESVSRMLGHTNLKTTQHYARIVDQKIADDMRQLTTSGKFQLA
ncbi:site-specific integrase [Phaeocystidibacter marisrubri]|uniref:Site-specific integrase n=1 Tax=Phaeocystidibacter marisrubri TaxID=1577780 RepID=A0A6L3ZD51_9FLAO|nr:site-specific integrase [Phaeocystidibacter marisrubri]KAB2815576.1 site-specific integrase [Phaeocystidibacter marisrubri]GGH64622.1 transposase [Phaeocystidibacter marisrubri]